METVSTLRNQVKPGLDDIRQFGESVLQVQRRWGERIAPTAEVSPEKARQRLADGISVLAGTAPPVEPELFRRLTLETLELFWAGKAAKETAASLLADPTLAPDRIQTFAARLIEDRDRCLAALGERTGLETGALASLFQVVLTPFYQKAASLFYTAVEESGWRRGYCPICSAWPRMARLLEANNPRTLFCGLCRSEWNFPRLRCPFCASDDQHLLRFFYVEDDRQHRVDVCDGCGHYLKTCRSPTADLALADMLSYRLDLLAAGEGYVPVA